LAALRGASGFIRKNVGQRINLRHTPEILIELDDSINYGMHMDELIHKISSKN
ncbi:ribosome-binding factor A, partial [Klebsiella pneumoniae]|nr:ribosome-binding factor A [Klebsiella pneumoniae]